MPTFHFVLNGWRGNYTVTAPTEHEARVSINPHMRLYKDAIMRARKYKDIAPSEATWYLRIAEKHRDDAQAFHKAAKLAAMIPMATLAPPRKQKVLPKKGNKT